MSEPKQKRKKRPSVGGGVKNRGFASMTPERLREVQSKGGKNAHEKGTAHRWTVEEASAAGEKAGRNRRRATREAEAPE